MTSTTPTITHEQAHGLRTDQATSEWWTKGVEAAKRHAGQASIVGTAEAFWWPMDYTHRMANTAWAEGRMSDVAFWLGYTAGAIRYRKVPGMAVIAG